MSPVSREHKIVTAVLMTVVIFTVDFLAPLWYDAWVLYLLPLFFMFQSAKRPYQYTAAISVLTATVLFRAHPEHIILMHAVANRTTGILGGWVVSFFLMQLRRLQDDRLRATDELETRIKDRTAELSQAKQMLEDVAQGITESILLISKDFKIQWANKAALTQTGLSMGELLGKTCHSATHGSVHRCAPPDDPCPVARIMEGNDGRVEHTHVDEQGSNVYVEVSAYPIKDRTGEIVSFVHITRDITERKKAQDTISRLAAIVESSDDAIIGKSLDGTVISWNAGAEKTYGYTKEEAIGRPIAFLLPPDRVNDDPLLLKKIAAGEHLDHYETIRMKKDGSLIDVSLTVSPLKSPSGTIIGGAIIARDITEKKKAEALLKQLSVIDSLTGLSNRRAFDAFLDKEWRRAFRSGSPLSLMMIDVDFFKKYNDTYGHLQGDESLKAVAAILKSITRRPGDIAARFGGEEFVVVLAMTDLTTGLALAEKIRSDVEALNRPHAMPKAGGYLTVSIGLVSVVPDKTLSPLDFVQYADERLYQAKADGRNRVAFKDLCQN